MQKMIVNQKQPQKNSRSKSAGSMWKPEWEDCYNLMPSGKPEPKLSVIDKKAAKSFFGSNK